MESDATKKCRWNVKYLHKSYKTLLRGQNAISSFSRSWSCSSPERNVFLFLFQNDVACFNISKSRLRESNNKFCVKLMLLTFYFLMIKTWNADSWFPSPPITYYGRGVFRTQSFSPYSVRMQENTDQKKLRTWTLFTQCLEKSCSLKFRNIHRETPVLESFVNGVTGLIELFVIKVVFERNILFPYVSFWRVRLKIHQKLKIFFKKELVVN